MQFPFDEVDYSKEKRENFFILKATTFYETNWNNLFLFSNHFPIFNTISKTCF